MGLLKHREDTHAVLADGVALAAVAFVQDDRGRALLHRAAGSGLWALPGGLRDPDESLGETVVRHAADQTGVTIQVLGLVGIYSDLALTVGGRDREADRLTVCVRARPSGRRVVGDASSETRWVAPEELAALPVHAAAGMPIRHGLACRADPFIDPRAGARVRARRSRRRS